ncbi:hypothetical protein [Streptomyces halobius]|uniref:Uncharacterized protein n=1 Tax=Streptomyces halobius TaxID=2879846 RepID=A0ABY4MDG8_9ACTN|nr:hypothetical protein [Streptomyces halobius]UQA95730.1 hypothetical protein K9S39_31140 [Streptomyces halobius]
MRDLPRDQRPIDDVAWLRVASNEESDRYCAVLNQAMADIDDGADLATAPWSAADPVRLAAEIEALAGARRLNTFRKDPK